MVIDVLLATFNGEKFLTAQLDSLASQKNAEFRVLMQDDGSADGTVELLRAREAIDDRFRLIDGGERPRGSVQNFFSLMQQSDAPYAALCDQDDVWHDNKLARCMDAMRTAELRWGAETPLLIHSDSRLIDADGKVLGESFMTHQGWDKRATSLPQLLVQNNVTGCTVLMNAALRDLAVKYGDPSKMFMHDWFLAQTAAAFGRVVCVAEPLVDYRQHGDNRVGASADSLADRGVQALSKHQKGKARMKLTYEVARRFAGMYRGKLMGEAERTVSTYIALESKWKLARVAGIQRGGYRMQSFVTRVGQLIFC